MLSTAHVVWLVLWCPLCFDYCRFVGSFGIRKCEASNVALPCHDCSWPLESIWVLISAHYFLSPANFYVVFLFSASVITFSFSLFFSRSSLLPAPPYCAPSLPLFSGCLSPCSLPSCSFLQYSDWAQGLRSDWHWAVCALHCTSGLLPQCLSVEIRFFTWGILVIELPLQRCVSSNHCVSANIQYVFTSFLRTIS